MKKLLLILICIVSLQANKIEIPSIDIITQLRHIVSKLKIKGIFIVPFTGGYIAKYSELWRDKFVSNSIEPSVVIKEFFDKTSFFYHFEDKSRILYVDLVGINTEDKRLLSNHLEYFKKNSMSKKDKIIIIRYEDYDYDFFIKGHKYPPSFTVNSFLENLKEVKYIPVRPDDYSDIDYVTYPVSYFMTFNHHEFINTLKKDNIFSIGEIDDFIKQEIWGIIYQRQDTLSLDYLMNSFYQIKCDFHILYKGREHFIIREPIAVQGFIPNPDIYNGRYSINGPFSDIAKKIYDVFPFLAIRNIEEDKELKDSIEYHKNKLKEVLDKRFGLDGLSEKQLHVLDNLDLENSKVVIKFWPDRYRTIRINHLFEIEDKLGYLIDMAETVNQLEDWFSLITIKE